MDQRAAVVCADLPEEIFDPAGRLLDVDDPGWLAAAESLVMFIRGTMTVGMTGPASGVESACN